MHIIYASVCVRSYEQYYNTQPIACSLYQLLVPPLLVKHGSFLYADERRRLRRCANDGQQVTDPLVNGINVGFHVLFAADTNQLISAK